jgi:hypothetical protein
MQVTKEGKGTQEVSGSSEARSLRPGRAWRAQTPDKPKSLQMNEVDALAGEHKSDASTQNSRHDRDTRTRQGQPAPRQSPH